MLTYQQLIHEMNQAMLGGNDDRVPLLKRVLSALDHPDHAYRIIHIAGTNGKGSTGSLIEKTFQQDGSRVGYFSSPAMVDQREQIRVNDELISPQAFVQTYQYIAERLPHGVTPQMLSIFEWWTLIMLQYFADQQVQWAVIECGLGGQDDATNAIDAPLLAVITHIALDHTRILGSTIKQIAKAKAGIIKAGTKAVFLAPSQETAAIKVITDRCHRQQVPLHRADTVQIERQGQQVQLTVAGQDISGRLNLLGTFQNDNVRTAALVVDWLITHQQISSWQPFCQTMATIQIAGRMQVVNHHPLTILDGAHNPDAARQIVATMNQLPRHGRLIMVIGFLADKDWRTMVDLYQPIADKLILTSPDNPQRALALSKLQAAVPNGLSAATGHDAMALARQMATPEDTILMTGSFYLIKEVEKDYD